MIADTVPDPSDEPTEASRNWIHEVLQPSTFRQENVARLMLRCFRQFERYVIEELAKREFADIRPTHLQILTHIPPEGIRSVEIATLANLTKQAVGQIATQLEEMGYIERLPDPDDGRARILVFTERGQKLADQSYEVLAACEARFADIIGHGALNSMRESLHNLVKNDASLPRPTRKAD